MFYETQFIALKTKKKTPKTLNKTSVQFDNVFCKKSVANKM